MMAVVSSVVLVLLLLLGKGAAFLKPVPFPHPPRFASPPTRLFQSTISTLQSTSEELLSLLLDRRQSQAISTNKIDTLVEALITTPSTFDPKVSLNGPLWIVCHRVGPTPLWESLSGSIRVNIQGQQYVYSDNERSVINYSQIVGKALNLRAYGTYEQKKPPKEGSNSTFSLFGDEATKTKLLSCPADFTVTVNQASIICFGKSFDIPISGTGFLRVLYADEKLRIFVSPEDTTDDRWERQGLVVVQVRSDLLGEAITL